MILASILSDTAQQFGVDWPHFLAQCVSFGIVLALLHRFAYRPILQVLAERRQRIKESLENAEKAQRKLAETQEEGRRILEEAGQRANAMIAEARQAAAQLLEQEQQKAIASANEILAKARTAAEADLARMRLELRKEVGRLVVETTARVTGKVLTGEDHRRLVEETNRELAA